MLVRCRVSGSAPCGLPSPTGKSRKAWSPRSANYMLGLLTTVPRDQMRQGHVSRNVAELVDRIPSGMPAELRLPTEECLGRRRQCYVGVSTAVSCR